MEIIRDKESWDAIVSSFPAWDVAHEWGYFEAYRQRDKSYDSILLYHNSVHGKIAYPFFIRKASLNENYLTANKEDHYLSAVYGYTGPLVEENSGQIWPEFQALFQSFIEENNIIAIEEKFHPVLKNNLLLIPESHITKKRDVVVILPDNEENLMLNYQRTSVKRGIKKAKKNGIEIKKEGIEKLPDFLDIYYQTMERNNAMEIYYFEENFFKVLAKELGERFVFFNAYYEGKLIASNLYLHSPTISFYFLGGQIFEYGSLQPISYIKHVAFAHYYELGIKYINEGGGRTGSDDDALLHFKSGFVQKATADQSILPYYTGETILFNKNKNDA